MRSQAAPAKAPEAAVLDKVPGELGVYMWKQVCIAVWLCQSTDTLIRRFRAVNERVVAAHTHVAYVHIVAPDTPLPTPGARAEISQLMREDVARHTATSVILGGGGFWASALRSVITGLRMMGAAKLQLDFHSDPQSAARWLAGQHPACGGSSFEAHELQDVVQRIAEEHGLLLKRRSMPPRKR